MSSRDSKASIECIFQTPGWNDSSSSSSRSSVRRPVTAIGTPATSKIHAPGRLPAYLARNRPSTTVESRYSRIPVLVKTNRRPEQPVKKVSRAKITPSEGGMVDAAELTLKIAELEQKYSRQQEMIQSLETEATEKPSVIDLLADRRKLEEQETTIAELRAELAAKCSVLIKTEALKDRVAALQNQLAGAERRAEETDRSNFELNEKLADAEAETLQLREKQLKLEERIARLLEEQEELQEEIRCMNRTIEERNAKIDAQQQELEKKSLELLMANEAVKQEQILLKIKSAILHTRLASGEPLRAASCCSAEKGCQAERIIDEIGQNHRRCRSARSKLLEMLQLLKRGTDGEKVSEELPALYEQPNADDPAMFGELKNQLMSQIQGLFPGEDFSEGEEQITSRIVYDGEVDDAKF